MDSQYVKMIEDKKREFIENKECFIELRNVVDGKERIFIISSRKYKQLTAKQKRLLVEEK